MEQFHEVEEEEKEEYEPLSRRKTIWKASGLLIGGAIMAIFFADPLVDSVAGFARASHIPPFFLSFVLLPFASNASEGISSIIFASRKRKMNMSMTYSQVCFCLRQSFNLGCLKKEANLSKCQCSCQSFPKCQ